MSNINIAMIACLKLRSPASILLTVSSSDVESADATLVSLAGSCFWALSSCVNRKGNEERNLEHNDYSMTQVLVIAVHAETDKRIGKCAD